MGLVDLYNAGVFGVSAAPEPQVAIKWFLPALVTISVIRYLIHRNNSIKDIAAKVFTAFFPHIVCVHIYEARLKGIKAFYAFAEFCAPYVHGLVALTALPVCSVLMWYINEDIWNSEHAPWLTSRLQTIVAGGFTGLFLYVPKQKVVTTSLPYDPLSASLFSTVMCSIAAMLACRGLAFIVQDVTWRTSPSD